MPTLVPYALCSLGDVQELLTASGATSTDSLATRAINFATELIEMYTNRRFLSTTYTNIEYDATGIDQIVLNQRPVTTFTSLEIRDTSLNEDNWETVDTELYFVDEASGVLDLNFRAIGHFNRYRVTYTAGYTRVPADVAEAAATLAAYRVQYPVPVTGIRTKQEGGRRIEYFDTSTTTSSLLQRLNLTDILDPYANAPVMADK